MPKIYTRAGCCSGAQPRPSKGLPPPWGAARSAGQERFLAQPRAPTSDSLQLFYTSFPCNVYFPQACSALHSPCQGISKTSVIIYQFVQDRISLESICFFLKKKAYYHIEEVSVFYFHHVYNPLEIKVFG